MAPRWSSLAASACVVALGLGGWLAWEDDHRAPDESVPLAETVLPTPPPEAGYQRPIGMPDASRARPAAAANVARASMQHYLSGVVYFQKADYLKARDEWALSVRLDPSNADAKAGLARLAALYGLKAEDAKR